MESSADDIQKVLDACPEVDLILDEAEAMAFFPRDDPFPVRWVFDSIHASLHARPAVNCRFRVQAQ
jgi:hypothetical protein